MVEILYCHDMVRFFPKFKLCVSRNQVRDPLWLVLMHILPRDKKHFCGPVRYDLSLLGFYFSGVVLIGPYFGLVYLSPIGSGVWISGPYGDRLGFKCRLFHTFNFVTLFLYHHFCTFSQHLYYLSKIFIYWKDDALEKYLHLYGYNDDNASSGVFQAVFKTQAQLLYEQNQEKMVLFASFLWINIVAVKFVKPFDTFWPHWVWLNGVVLGFGLGSSKIRPRI